QERITNGQTASEGEFPYQALIYDYFTYCGGSIIHKRWILTVAHCESFTIFYLTNIIMFRYKNYAAISVFVGTNKNLGIGGVRYAVKTIIKNKNFVNVRNLIVVKVRANMVLNDIALIRVATDIQFNERVKPVSLPLDNIDKYENTFATVSGWGKLRPNANLKTYLPRNLQRITIQVLEQQNCRRSWPNLVEHHLCTSIPDGKATCEGDSGSPLVVGNTQIGIVSYADAECGLVRPVVYTRVSSFLPWIRKQLYLFGELFRSILIFCIVHAGWGLTMYKGTEAYLGQFPYQAMLLLNDQELVCGGSIIHKRWILTAGHCKVSNTYDEQYTVAIGGIKASAIDAVRYPIEAFIVHSQYDIQFSTIVRPIKLPTNNLNKYENDLAILSGWGKVNPNKFAETLQYIQIRIVRQQVCAYYWQDQFNPVHESQICTSVAEQKSVCNGDSGGPLVVNDTQVGVVSYGSFCLQIKPDVYTRVSYFLPWIKYQMRSYKDALPY
ncbi:hypothetical protein TSAR_016236, partial [Trichomalopsis sarcophagae]